MKTIAVLLALIAFSASSFAQVEPTAPIKVAFLHVNDVYQFMPVDGGKNGGLARLLTLKQQTGSETPHVLLTLGGDTLSPSVESRTFKGAQMIDAWNAIGLDYAVFGNHEFDLKTAELEQRIEESRFTWLGANIIDNRSGAIFANTPEFVVREFEGVKIGLLGIDWEIIPVTEEIPDAPEFASVVDDYRDTIKRFNVPVGKTEVVLDALTHSNRNRETNLGNFVADCYRAAVGADVGFVNGGSIRSDLIYYPGVLTKRDVISILPFNNPIVKVAVSGLILKQALEHGVARSGEDSEPGRFPQVSGMAFSFDASAPAGNRIRAMSVGGQPLDEARIYTVATSDFLALRGGDGYAMFSQGSLVDTPVADPNVALAGAATDSDVLEQAIASAPDGAIAPRVEGRILRID